MTMTYPPDQQRAILRANAKRGAYRTLALLQRKMDEIIELAIDRAMSDEALSTYGDSMFHQSLPELEWETWEELADAINRQSVYNAKENGIIP